MDEKQTLQWMLEKIDKAEKLVFDDDEKREHLKSIFDDLRQRAQAESKRLDTERILADNERAQRGDEKAYNPTPYQLCMVGVREEAILGMEPLPSTAYHAKLTVMREDIERTKKLL